MNPPTNSLRAMTITKFGGPGVLELREFPRVALDAGQLRIGVKAAGVNFADLMMI